MDEKAAFELAEKNGYDKAKVWEYIKRSRGNWMEIRIFLIEGKNKKQNAKYNIIRLFGK